MCNYKTYAIETDPEYPKCNNTCPLEKCNICEDDTGNCLECINPDSMDIDNSCECKTEGYYKDMSDICQECDPGCVTCE